MDNIQAQVKLKEAIERLSDISANIQQGPRHIRKYIEELDLDLTKSERILMDVRGFINQHKQDAQSEESQKPVSNPGARKFGGV